MSPATTTSVLSRLSQAILRNGATGLATLMAEDAVLELPLVAPPVRIQGRSAIAAFLGNRRARAAAAVQRAPPRGAARVDHARRCGG
ncbi:MAG TPA: hypothetical protein VFG86_14985 [Chloroflexota bacterium]|jgi:hypothetical protein|nr:hypothetical protein [Chloroflexota bacterium]